MADMTHFLQPCDGNPGGECDMDNFDEIVFAMSGDSCIAATTGTVFRGLHNLPTEILLHIASMLDYKSLCRLGISCKKLQSISLDESLWKRFCETEYLMEENSTGEGWRSLFISFHTRFGRYHSTEIYRVIRDLWTRLENYLKVNDLKLYSKLREPCSHGEIKIAEDAMKHRFPSDLRCSLQIHNGQINDTGIGVHGTVSIGSYHRSESLLDAAGMAREYKHEGVLMGCVPLTHCLVSRTSEYIAVDSSVGIDVGSVIYPVQQGLSSGVFYSARSFTEWLRDLVESLELKFPRIDNLACRFVRDPECMAKSHDCFEVTAATCFMPDISTIEPPCFLHVYRITMSMDANAPKVMSCKLVTRHWIITDETGQEEYVDGPGVVGEYPVMSPGASFSWVSCCTLPTTYGNMRGHFCMKNLQTDEELFIDCPVFHMKCLPNEMTSDYLQRGMQKKKKL